MYVYYILYNSHTYHYILLYKLFYQQFCFIQLFSNVGPINSIIPTSLIDIIVDVIDTIYVIILYTRLLDILYSKL